MLSCANTPHTLLGMPHNKYSYFKQLEHMSSQDSSLSKLLHRASGILIHQDTVRSILDAASREHCWLANYRNGTLYLQSDSAAWGTRIRMQQRMIVQQLKRVAAFKDIQSVKVSIQPRAKAQRPERTAKEISAANARQLEATAQTTDDAKLSAALEQLAVTARRGKTC